MHSPQENWLGATNAATKAPSPDVLVRNAGTLYLFRPLNARAKEWIVENVQLDAQWITNSLVVEARYALPLTQAMLDQGLVLA